MIERKPILNHVNQFHNFAYHFLIREVLDVRVLEYVLLSLSTSLNSAPGSLRPVKIYKMFMVNTCQTHKSLVGIQLSVLSLLNIFATTFHIQRSSGPAVACGHAMPCCRGAHFKVEWVAIVLVFFSGASSVRTLPILVDTTRDFPQSFQANFWIAPPFRWLSPPSQYARAHDSLLTILCIAICSAQLIT